MSFLFGHRNKAVGSPGPKVLHYDHLPVPIHLFIERRSNSRISLLKEKIHIRLPARMPRAVREVEMKKLITWAQARISKKGIYDKARLDRDLIKDPILRFNDTTWELVIVESSNRKTFKADLDDQSGRIMITGPFSMHSGRECNDVVKRLLTRLLCNHYLEHVNKLVSAINDVTFKSQYNKVRLKYMTSRWGSCSSKNNINLSLRILMLPDHVRDYIIVHELAHLKEMNHSHRFWKLVGAHVPDYKQIEKWLKQNGSKYDL